MADGTGRRLPTPEASVEKMQRRLDAAGGDWKAGVTNPRRDPIAAAIAAKDKHKQRTMDALNSDRYAKGLAQVDKAAMAATIAATPDSAVADGVRRRGAKVLSRTRKYYGLLGTHLGTIDAMPTTTAADSESKMLANLRGMRKIKDGMRS